MIALSEVVSWASAADSARGRWFVRSPAPTRLGRGAAVRSAATEAITVARTEDRRPSGQEHLPVLRGRAAVSASTSRASASCRSRAIPDSPVSRGRLCPKGSASEQLVNSPGRATHGQVPAPVRHRVGGPPPRASDGDDRRPRPRDPAPAPGRTSTTSGEGAAPHARHRQPRRRDAGQRRELPHQEALHRRSESYRSRTRPVFDTVPPSPVWGPRSDAAEPRPSSRTCRTLTASSSRARTWPSATRSASSG